MWRVTWAHPEFGQVLATCSFDNTAAVWEEQSKRFNNRNFMVCLLGVSLTRCLTDQMMFFSATVVATETRRGTQRGQSFWVRSTYMYNNYALH